MRIAIMGSGSMGSLFGGLLTESGLDVIFVDMWEEHVEAMNEDGLTVVDPDGEPRTLDVTATTDPANVDPVDVVMIFVKCYHTESAISDAEPLLSPSTDVVTLQNGLTNPELIAEYVDEKRIIAGTTTMSAQLTDPGRVVHRDVGSTTIGRYFTDNDEGIHDIADHFSGEILQIDVTDSIRDVMWKKALISVTYNPITALARVRVGDVVDDPAGRELLEEIVEETVRVAESRGRTIDDPLEFVVDVGHEHPTHKTSMRHDVEEGRKTEVEYMSGAVARYAEKEGVDAPINRTMANLVRLAENSE